jgi:hypothetical protein
MQRVLDDIRSGEFAKLWISEMESGEAGLRGHREEAANQLLEQVGEELRSLMRLFPAGVCVVGTDAHGDRLAVTVGSLVSLSLDPPLVGISIGRELGLHELLRSAGTFGVSILRGGASIPPWGDNGRAGRDPRRPVDPARRRGDGRRRPAGDHVLTLLRWAARW